MRHDLFVRAAPLIPNLTCAPETVEAAVFSVRAMTNALWLQAVGLQSSDRMTRATAMGLVLGTAEQILALRAHARLLRALGRLK